ncbi:MAG: Modification methylase AplI [Candidatus Heimdallarchaeota archaeon LC_3]|nr:MAG: Modification methylase AplI [Candidatus Heimdallarchaeota archaeon LC_3]
MNYILDAFSGAGFSAEGFKSFYNVVEAIDNNFDACNSYKLNHKDTSVKNMDIRDISFSQNDYQGILGLIATPPCQDFSDLSHNYYNEDRANLVFQFIRLLEEIQPEFALFENVYSVPKIIKLRLEKEIQQLGYKTVSRVINAWEYGCLQIRKRWIITVHKKKHIFPKKSNIRRKSKEILSNEISEIKPRKQTLDQIKDLETGKWVNLPNQKYKVYFVLDPEKPFPAVVNPTKLRYIHPNKKQYLSFNVLIKTFGVKSFNLTGNLSSKGQQLANGFPSDLAYKFAKSFSEVC